jgi:glycosyltransferase involved in cell wall biosynthesis
MMRILFLTTILPAAGRTGSEVVSRAFVTALRAAGHDVTVLGYQRPGSPVAAGPGDVAVAERFIETSQAGWRAAPWLARAVLTRRPYSAAKYVSRAYRAAVAGALDGVRLVVADHAQMGWAVPRERNLPHVYLAHNVEHALYAEQARGSLPARRLYGREARLVGREERRLCRESAAVWALTTDDGAALRELCGREVTVFTVPPATIAPAPAEPTCDVALLGTWTWQPNAAGLRWFADAVLPALAGLDVRVAGAGARDVLGERAGLTLSGRVPDATAFLQQARVIAVPSVAGSGVQVKTLDAIAAGRPVVATATAMRGIADPPASVRVADDPAAFAEAVRAAAGADGGAEGIAWARERERVFRGEIRAAVEAVAR